MFYTLRLAIKICEEDIQLAAPSDQLETYTHEQSGEAWHHKPFFVSATPLSVSVFVRAQFQRMKVSSTPRKMHEAL